jgi:protein-tyrosine phosphatase
MDRRAFLSATAGALALPRLALAAPLAAVAAARSTPQTVKLQWDAAAGPASIFIASTPYAGQRALKPAAAAVAGGAAEVAAPSAPRPYFLIRARDGAESWTAERLLPLQGGRNFRDMGGYAAAGGKTVRWGKLYRSGVMNGLTATDLSYLSALGINTICDLRSVQERQAEPSAFLKTSDAKVVAFDYAMASSLDGIARARSREEAVSAFAATYIGFLDMLTPQYTDMFARLVRGEAPLTFNCSAGKDRTGTAAALILSVLDVPRETVVADYALTQTYTPPAAYAAAMSSGKPSPGLTPQLAEAMRHMPPEVLQVLMGSDPEVMRQALAQVDKTYGGPAALVKAKFGVTDEGLARMRQLYLV